MNCDIHGYYTADLCPGCVEDWYAKASGDALARRVLDPKGRYYVRRDRSGKTGWVGPLRGGARARAEANAWIGAGWAAEVIDVDDDSRAEVAAWQKEANVRLGR
jgi:hypothetical protein